MESGMRYTLPHGDPPLHPAFTWQDSGAVRTIGFIVITWVWPFSSFPTCYSSDLWLKGSETKSLKETDTSPHSKHIHIS